MSADALMTGPADLRDQRWLDEQVADLGRGIEAARAIWSNWFTGRCVGRLHPGMGPGEYIASLGLRLTLPEAMAAMPDASVREVAAVAGRSVGSVHAARQVFSSEQVPERVTGADGKSYPRVVREVTAEIIEEEPIDLDSVPGAAAESESVWIADLRRYIAGVVNVPPPPQTDPARYRRLRRALVPALNETLDRLARDI